jgi:hypothetical protein
MGLEEPQGVGVGEHERGAALVQQRIEHLGVKDPVRSALDLDDLHPVEGRARRVRAVRGIGDEDAHALAVTARAVIRLNHHHPHELALGARCRLKGHTVQTRDLGQRHLQLVCERERPLNGRFRGQRVYVHKAWKLCRHLVQLRVVLHRARPERVEARVDSVVPLGQASEVTNHVELGELREALNVVANMLRAEHVPRIRPRHLCRLDRDARAARSRALEEQRLVEDEPASPRRAHAASSRTTRSISSRVFISVVQTRS